MKPERLYMESFLSHDKSEINFNKFDVALILGRYDGESEQSNGAGKSAIFEAIAWALFGKSRHKKKNGVVKWDKTSCKVEFEFFIDEEKYMITRIRDKVINDSDIEFKQWNSLTTQYDDISCDTNTSTDKKILDTINVNYEVFINSSYFKQNDISIFAQSTPGKRKDVLKELLRMDKWDKYESKAKDHVRKISASIKEKTQNVIPIDKIINDILECDNDIFNIKNIIVDTNKMYTKISDDLVNKKTEYQSLQNANPEAELKKIERDYAVVKGRLSEITSKKIENDNIIGQNNDKISELDQKIKFFKDQIKQAKNISVDGIRNKISQGTVKNDILKERIKELKINVNLINECDRCKKPLTKKDITDIQNARKIELNESIKKHASISSHLNDLTREMQNLEKIINNSSKFEIDKSKSEIKLLSFKNIINEKMEENIRLISEQKKLLERDYKKEIQELRSQCEKDYKEKLEVEIKNLNSSLEKIKFDVDSLNVDYGSKVRKKEHLIELQKEQIKIQKEIDSLNSEFTIYDKLRICFGKDGVQSVIIENIIEELENYANDTLSKICNEPTSVSIQTQKQNDNGSWSETFDIIIKSGSRVDEFETYSGGEQFRVSLSLRLALSNILSKRMGGAMNFLLLDEVSSNLDNKGLDMFINIVKQIGNTMKVLVITHNEKLKEKFENIIMVDKGVNGSNITLC